MCDFTRQDLKQEYIWRTKEDDVKKITGFPADVILNCTQGYEILYFINRYMEHIGWCTLVSFNNIELIIKSRLPFGKRTHKDVKEWLDNLLQR